MTTATSNKNKKLQIIEQPPGRSTYVMSTTNSSGTLASTTTNNNPQQRNLFALFLAFICLIQISLPNVNAFVVPLNNHHHVQHHHQHHHRSSWTTVLFLVADNKDDQADEQEGADLAAEFFKMAQQKGIGMEGADETYNDDDEEEEDDDDEEEEVNIPQGAINAFLGYDTGDVGEKLAGNVSLTDDQLYSEVKERVLDTAGGFVEYVKGASDDDYDDDDDDAVTSKKPKQYVPPETVPDSELTAGEVVELVLEALRNNDNPTPNRGVEILFGYSSAGSQIKNEVGLTPTEYAEFLKETEYKVLFDHYGISIDKGDYSFDGKKAFFTARVQVGAGPMDQVAVNFILSTTGVDEDACWLVDSMLIRPQSMRRRRRR